MKLLKVIFLFCLIQVLSSSLSLSQSNLYSIEYSWDSTHWSLEKRTFIDDFPSQGIRAKFYQSYDKDSLKWSSSVILWDTLYFNASGQLDLVKYYFNWLGAMPYYFADLKNTFTQQGLLDSVVYYNNFSGGGWAKKFEYDSNGIAIKKKEYFADLGFDLKQESQNIFRDAQNRDTAIYWADYNIGSPDTIIDIVERFEYNSIDSLSYSSKQYFPTSQVNFTTSAFHEKIYSYNAQGYRSQMLTYDSIVQGTNAAVSEMRFEYFYNSSMQLDSTVRFRKIPGTSNYLRDYKWEYFPIVLDLEISNEEDLVKVFPNPASNEINIDVSKLRKSNFSIRILDLNGDLIFEGSISINSSKFDISNFKPGLYFYEISSEDQHFKGRFIKQ